MYEAECGDYRIYIRRVATLKHRWLLSKKYTPNNVNIEAQGETLTKWGAKREVERACDRLRR